MYFKDVGLWLVSESNPQCFVKNMGSLSSGNRDFRNACCQRQKYWPSPTDSDLQATLQTIDEKQKQIKLKRDREHAKDVNFWRQEETRYRESVKTELKEENVLADDGAADDKLEEEGDLSQKKRDTQKLKRARASLSSGQPGVVTKEVENEEVVGEEEVEGYGAGVPLETFDTNTNERNAQTKKLKIDNDDNDDDKDGNDDNDDDKDDNDDNVDDDADGDDDKYDDDRSVSQPRDKQSDNNKEEEEAVFL